jgi:hypothetical protein
MNISDNYISSVISYVDMSYYLTKIKREYLPNFFNSLIFTYNSFCIHRQKISIGKYLQKQQRYVLLVNITVIY